MGFAAKIPQLATVALVAGALVVVGNAGCGGQAKPARSEDARQAADPVSQNTRASVAGRGCPKPLRGGSRAGERALRTVRSHLREIFHGTDVRGAVLYGAIALRRDEVVPGLRYRMYFTKPARVCGKAVVNASWVILVALPRATMASLSPALVYVVRTMQGWRPWYLIFPNLGTAKLLPP